MIEYTSPHTEEEWKQLVIERGEAIEKEETLWKQQGFHFGMINIDMYQIQFKLNVLITFLQEELGITETELQARFLQEAYDQLKRDRGMLIEAMAKASRPDMAIVKKQILGPGGTPL